MLDPFANTAIRSIGDAGHPLSYVESGCGPLLLLVHGSLCDLRYWRWQIPALSEQFRVVAPSLRGYWPRAFDRADPSFSVRRHTADLADIIGAIGGGGPVHVLGHSRGARVALELAMLAPDAIASLILADPGLSPASSASSASSAIPALSTPSASTSSTTSTISTSSPAAAAAFQKRAVERLAAGDVEGALAGFIDTVNGPDTWRRMTSWFKNMVRDNAGTLFSQVAEHDAVLEPSRVGALECPVLLLGGEYSPARYARAMDELQAVLAHAQRDVIPGASHGMNLGNARAFNDRVTRFVLEAQGGTPSS